MGAARIIKAKKEKLQIKGTIVITPRINPSNPDSISNFFKKNLFDSILIPLFLYYLNINISCTHVFRQITLNTSCMTNSYGNRLVMFEDKPMNYDAWDIDIYYSEKSWTTDEVLSYEWVSVGEVCAILRVVKKMSLSTITQDIIFYADSRRIDIKNVVDWKNSQTLLKVFFETDVHSDEATFDIQFGSIKRKTHTNTSWDVARFECCGQKYVDVSEGRYGVALLNDCKYGHSVKNGKIGLSLIKSGIYPNPDADKEIHEFTYSLYPHGCSYLDSETIENSYYLNQPLLSFEGETELDKFSLASTDKKNVVIETIKYAEDGSGDIIIRLYESQNTRTKFKLDATIKFDNAYLVNLMEEHDQKIDSVDDGRIELDIKPFEILTIKLSGLSR